MRGPRANLLSVPKERYPDQSSLLEIFRDFTSFLYWRKQVPTNEPVFPPVAPASAEYAIFRSIGNITLVERDLETRNPSTHAVMPPRKEYLDIFCSLN
jgi:hypothetical protein